MKRGDKDDPNAGVGAGGDNDDNGQGYSRPYRNVEGSLKTWEKWQKMRNKQANKLQKKTGRPGIDLAMNELEQVRKKKEEKVALEHAQIEEMPKLRGELWKQPQRLTQACPCANVYEMQRTKHEIGEPEIIEHIGVPRIIQATEKGLSGVTERPRFQALDKDYESYRRKRESELSEKIKKIDPYRPDLSEIVCIGHRPKPPPPKIPLLPIISVSAPYQPPCEPLHAVWALRINNSVYFNDKPGHTLDHLRAIKKESWYEKCTNWTYYFNIPTRHAGRGTFYLENLGTISIRYCWKKIKKEIPYIPEDVCDQVFFFNKNEDVICPGQKRNINFTFVSEHPGIYNETWQFITCNVEFTEIGQDQLLVVFFADATEGVMAMNRKINKLQRKITSHGISQIVHELVSRAVAKATIVEPQLYPYRIAFLEAEIFVMKNPVCFYHQTEVASMKDHYEDMAPDKTWDLSIESWREEMMAKEFEERMRYFDILKQSHSELLKPWYDGEDVAEQKYRAVNLILTQLMNKFDSEYDKLSPSSANSIGGNENEPNPGKSVSVQNVFYMIMREHVSYTMGLCAGVISSIDLNRWIEFDFCRTK